MSCEGAISAEPARKLIIAALCSIALLFGCRIQNRSQPDILITHEISPDPPAVGPAVIVLKVTDSAGQTVSGAKIKIEGNMSHPGMAPVFSVAHEVSPGRYQVSLEFTMSGDWILLEDLTLPDGRQLQRTFDVKNVRPVHK